MEQNKVVTFERGVWGNYEELMGNYVMSFEAKLQLYVRNGYETIGSAWVILTDEKWIKDREGLSLIDAVHYDFNDEMNWNEYTIYEYLEDTLRCTRYGEKDGTHGKIARILKIQIDEKHRGKGYFSFFFGKLISFIEKFEADFISVMPSPFGFILEPEHHTDGTKEEIIKAGEERLQKFYSKFGFVHCNNEGHPYMVKDMKTKKQQYA